MPLLIHCDELQAGMRLAEAFMWRERMMLPGGKVLTRDDIDILQAKYPDVTLKVGDPVLDSLAEFEDDTHDREVATTAQQMVAQSLSKVQERFAARTAIASVNFNAMRNAAMAVIDYLKDNPVSAALLNRSMSGDNYIAEHSGNVFYLALVLGSSVRDYVVRERLRQTSASHLSTAICMDLLPLALGAMFMDIGMFPLSHLFKPGYELTDEDRKLIRQHPIASCEQLPDSLPAGVKMVVRTHHENFDGTGYPSAMPGAQQHIFTRIVRICDAFEAATAQRVYAQAKSPVRVLWEICAGPWKHCYDPVLSKMFRSLIQPFPIGAKLRLADGRWAVLVRYNHKEPFQPTVIVAFDAKGNRLPTDHLLPAINVGDGNSLRLGSYDGEDLSFLYEDSKASKTPAEAEAELDELLRTAYP